MLNDSTSTQKVVLVDDEQLGRIEMSLDGFFDLSFSLAEDLEDLVAKWSHLAAPRANRKRSQEWELD